VKISGSSTYSDFTDEFLTTLKRGDTYTLQADGHTTSSYTEFVKAWIDFNNDKEFSDTEGIDLGNATFDGNHTFSKTFTVPDDAVSSEARMRVYLKYGDAPSPCENANYGEVEEYTVKIISPAVLADNYSDYGIDTDGDGYYNYLAIDVGVNVTEPGYYRVNGELYENETYNSVDYVYNTTYLNEGSQTLQLRFEGIKIRSTEYNGTYNLKYLYLYDTTNWSRLDYRYCAYTTSYYNYTDFEPLHARFTSGFYDYGEDTDSDSLYDYLVIEKEVNVAEAGDYNVYSSLYSPSGDYVDSDSNYTNLSAGLHNVTLKFQGWKLYKAEESGNFEVKMDLYYYPPESTAKTTTLPTKITADSQHIPARKDSGGRKTEFDNYGERQENKTLEEREMSSTWLDSMENTTFYYSYTEFKPPLAEFNDQYNDSGEDTDGDGLYDYLVVDVGVNVTEAGDYKVSGSLCENGTYDSVDYYSNMTYLSEGNQTIQLRFEGIKIRQNEYNETYDLKSLYLYNYSPPAPPPPVSTPTPPPISVPVSQHESKSTEAESISVGYGEQLDYRYYAYTTSYYNYTDFQLPPAEFNNIYADYGTDTDGDGLYNYLTIDVGVNVTKVGRYRIRGELYDNTGHSIDYKSNTTYLSTGSQTVQLNFEGMKIRQNEGNGPYNLKSLYLYNSSTGDQLDYIYDAYTTPHYNYTDFDPVMPPVIISLTANPNTNISKDNPTMINATIIGDYLREIIFFSGEKVESNENTNTYELKSIEWIPSSKWNFVGNNTNNISVAWNATTIGSFIEEEIYIGCYYITDGINETYPLTLELPATNEDNKFNRTAYITYYGLFFYNGTWHSAQIWYFTDT